MCGPLRDLFRQERSGGLLVDESNCSHEIFADCRFALRSTCEANPRKVFGTSNRLSTTERLPRNEGQICRTYKDHESLDPDLDVLSRADWGSLVRT